MHPDPGPLQELLLLTVTVFFSTTASGRHTYLTCYIFLPNDYFYWCAKIFNMKGCFYGNPSVLMYCFVVYSNKVLKLKTSHLCMFSPSRSDSSFCVWAPFYHPETWCDCTASLLCWALYSSYILAVQWREIAQESGPSRPTTRIPDNLFSKSFKLWCLPMCCQ